MKELDEGICSINNVKANGVKEDGNGLAIIESFTKTVGVFTNNKIKAAPVRYTRQLLNKSNEVDNFIINSGCANAFTGEKGLKDTKWMSDLLEGNTAVCSTGVIGERIDRKWIKEKFDELSNNLKNSAEGSKNAANAIRTTDNYLKEVSVEVGDLKVAGIAKGSGMIEPNMGTMLAFIFTNANLSNDYLRNYLKKEVNNSFNMVVVDGDTSTNDTVLLSSTKAIDNPNKNDFKKGLSFVCEKLAKKIAKDGEGATKFIEVNVSSCRNKREAKSIAKEILRSSLVKTMFYGENPNIGRIAAAIGNSSSYVEEEKIEIKLNDNLVVNDGVIVLGKEDLRELLTNKKIDLSIDLGLGLEKATAWGCDLSPEYVEINAGYV